MAGIRLTGNPRLQWALYYDKETPTQCYDRLTDVSVPFDAIMPTRPFAVPSEQFNADIARMPQKIKVTWISRSTHQLPYERPDEFCKRPSETIQEVAIALNQHKGILDTANWASRYALDVIGSAGLGKDFMAIQDENNALVKVCKKVFKVSKQQRTIFLLNTFLPWWLLSNLPLSHNHEFLQASKAIRQVCQDVIHQRRAQYACEGVWGTDLLSTAIQIGRFSDENLIDQVMTFLAAGHETTESSLVWAIYLLAKHPELQKTLRVDIPENVPPIESDAEITSDDIKRVPLLHAVCNETLRIFGPVRLTMREAACDTYLQDSAVPCGIKFMISSCATNIDETLWGPDASEFNPYRWLSENEEGNWVFLHEGGATSKYAMLTFSQGHRGCIGQGFAKAEFACLISGWLGRFSFQLEA